MIQSRRFWCRSRSELVEVASIISKLDASSEHAAEIIVRPLRKEKTHDQRKAWHALVTEFAQHLGYTPGQMKQLLKEEYYGVDIIKLPNGKKYRMVQSTEDEDRAGYVRLVDWTIDFADKQGIHLEIKPKFGKEPS